MEERYSMGQTCMHVWENQSMAKDPAKETDLSAIINIVTSSERQQVRLEYDPKKGRQTQVHLRNVNLRELWKLCFPMEKNLMWLT
ncbi:hypothetical protein KM043_013115 [Ampulex compressa]|nr:hypothetical protein KM043_013115 [Ampulex compressa]